MNKETLDLILLNASGMTAGMIVAGIGSFIHKYVEHGSGDFLEGKTKLHRLGYASTIALGGSIVAYLSDMPSIKACAMIPGLTMGYYLSSGIFKRVGNRSTSPRTQVPIRE